MKIECAIFDFDGTLFDSMFIWESVGESYLRSLGQIPKPSLREDVKTLSLYQSAGYLKREYHLSLSVEEIMAGINAMVEDFYIRDILPKEGVIDFLNQMKSLNIPMCIATATDRYQIEAALKRCEMNHYFDEILTCSEVGYGKDEPIIYRAAMEHFKASRSTTLIFEDAFHAIQTAKLDGFKTVAVFDESENRQNEINSLSDCYIFNFKHTDHFWEFIKKENHKYENSINNCR